MLSNSSATSEDNLPINQIVWGDFLEVSKLWPNECIDLIVTDPPYNSSIEWDKKDDIWQERWLREAYRLLKTDGSLYFFFAPLNSLNVHRIVKDLFTLKNLIVWQHKNLYGAGLNFGADRYKSTWEVVFYATKGKGKDVQKRCFEIFGNTFDVMTEPAILKGALHRAQKPERLLAKYILCSSDENDIVLDPFCGSGSTCIVAKKLKRRYIGVEINQIFSETARKRLQLMTAQDHHFTKETGRQLFEE